MQENIFEWQFAIRGPNDTEFEGGIYHGRIQLPSEYPFKPPSFMLLTVIFDISFLIIEYIFSTKIKNKNKKALLLLLFSSVMI